MLRLKLKPKLYANFKRERSSKVSLQQDTYAFDNSANLDCLTLDNSSKFKVMAFSIVKNTRTNIIQAFKPYGGSVQCRTKMSNARKY